MCYIIITQQCTFHSRNLYVSALHLARVFHRAGHSVILAGKDDFDGYSLPYFSNHVQTFVPLNSEKSAAQFGEKLLKLWYFNHVDWFVPILNPNNTEGIFEAVERMKNCASKKDLIYADLLLNEPALEMLKPLKFYQECESMGLKVPNYNALSQVEHLQQFQSLGLFDNNQRYYLNSKTKSIPIQVDNLTSVLAKVKEDPEDQQFVLTNEVTGDKYLANVICQNGHLLMLQVIPKRRVSVVNYTPPGIVKWVTQFVSAKSLSGMFTIEFGVAQQSQETTGISMLPTIQLPSIFSAQTDREVAELEKILHGALNNENANNKPFNPGNRKSYWICNEIESLVTGQQSLDQFFDTLQHGNEVLVSRQDPWPFLALHYLHLPLWILRKAGKFDFDWSYPDFVEYLTKE